MISEARSPEAFQLLVEQLHGDVERFRILAIRGLENLDTDEAREALFDYFQMQLNYGDEPSMRIHAIEGLSRLGTQEAYYVLRSAKKLTFESYEETAEFQNRLSQILGY